MTDIIIDGNTENAKDERMKSIAVNALKAMTDILVDMSKASMDSKMMMDNCVWPIIYEAAERFEKVKNDEKNVPLDGFDEIKF